MASQQEITRLLSELSGDEEGARAQAGRLEWLVRPKKLAEG
jgi:hypothetical protein